jgi:hypothetical protein
MRIDDLQFIVPLFFIYFTHVRQVIRPVSMFYIVNTYN